MTEFRRKRGDTKIGTIEKKYGKDLGFRSDKELGNVLKETGFSSLTQLLKASDAKGSTKKSPGSRKA